MIRCPLSRTALRRSSSDFVPVLDVDFLGEERRLLEALGVRGCHVAQRQTGFEVLFKRTDILDTGRMDACTLRFAAERCWGVHSKTGCSKN